MRIVTTLGHTNAAIVNTACAFGTFPTAKTVPNGTYVMTALMPTTAKNNRRWAVGSADNWPMR